MRIDTEILFERYKDSLFGLSLCICKEIGDAEEIIQDAFLKYHTSDKEFESEQHIRHWLSKVVVNMSRNSALVFWKRARVSVEALESSFSFESEDSENLFSSLMSLPPKYSMILHLFYHEGYGIREISQITGLSESNVKTRLSRGRAALKQLLKEEWKEEWNDD